MHIFSSGVKAFEGQRVAADVAKTGTRVVGATAAAIINPASGVGAAVGKILP